MPVNKKIVIVGGGHRTKGGSSGPAFVAGC